MATVDAAPPSYNANPSSVIEGELPEYSRNAAADERIVLSQPSAPRPTTAAPVEYVFQSERIELYLGEKKYPVKVRCTQPDLHIISDRNFPQVPCYGWNSVIEGKVKVKDFKAVVKVTVTLEGTCYTSVMERGMAVYSHSKILLFMPRILWSRSENATVPEEAQDFTFSFQLPTHAQGTNIRLPHSYATAHVGLNADVTYQLRVDLFRKGLRRHERLKTMVLYLPRSTPPEASFRRHDSFGGDIVEWESVPIYPKYFLPPTKNNEVVQHVEENPAEAINLILPLPKAYASAAPIPFHLSFPSDSPFLPYIVTHMTVHLIKYTILRAGGFVSVKDGIIGVGEIWHVDDGSYPTPPPSPSLEDAPSTVPRKVYHGTLKSFREGGETSWNIPAFLEIRYSIRVRIRVPDVQHDGKPLPEYLLDHPIMMCTHNRIPNAEDLHDPVIGLIAVAGSQGVSTNRLAPAAVGLRA